VTDTVTGSLPAYRCTVLPEWIDYNGHMSEAFYVLVFGFATDQVMDELGMDKLYRQETRSSLYTVEAHVRYLLETGLGAELKKLHLAHELRSGDQLAATEEILALHVNKLTGRTEAFPQAINDNITRVRPTSEHQTPEWVGRKVTA
jgi:acyl-CoA thioesterase FadM